MKPPPKSKFLQLFERDQGRCVYCGMDLKADYDWFMMATEDHFVSTSKGGDKSRNLDNLILSCMVCNRLKANHTPADIDPVKERRKYVAAVRAYIYRRRSERMKDFTQVTHPNKATISSAGLKTVRLYNRPLREWEPSLPVTRVALRTGRYAPDRRGLSTLMT